MSEKERYEVRMFTMDARPNTIEDKFWIMARNEAEAVQKAFKMFVKSGAFDYSHVDLDEILCWNRGVVKPPKVYFTCVKLGSPNG